jgi:hypothetical protein
LLGSRKPLQQALAHRLLPRSLQQSLRGSTNPWRRKHGFDVPVAEWFRGAFRTGLRQFLVGPDSVIPAYVNANFVNRALDAFLEGTGRRYRQILSLYALEVCLRANTRADFG